MRKIFKRSRYVLEDLPEAKALLATDDRELEQHQGACRTLENKVASLKTQFTEGRQQDKLTH